MRKPTFCICENKEADQLCSNRTDSTIPLLSKSEISSLKPSSVAVQHGLCLTRSETRMLVFSRRSSTFTIVLYSSYKENYVSKKRKNGFSRSRSRSRSRSSRSRSSRSFSPAQKKRKEHSPVRKLKKNKYSQEKYSSNDKYSSKDIHKSRKRKQRSQSRSHSVSVSPERKSSHKKHNKDRTEKYYSPPERHSTKRTKNGQHLSPTRDRYEKYDRYDKYDKYEKHDRYEKVDKYEKYRR